MIKQSLLYYIKKMPRKFPKLKNFRGIFLISKLLGFTLLLHHPSIRQRINQPIDIAIIQLQFSA